METAVLNDANVPTHKHCLRIQQRKAKGPKSPVPTVLPTTPLGRGTWGGVNNVTKSPEKQNASHSTFTKVTVDLKYADPIPPYDHQSSTTVTSSAVKSSVSTVAGAAFEQAVKGLATVGSNAFDQAVKGRSVQLFGLGVKIQDNPPHIVQAIVNLRDESHANINHKIAIGDELVHINSVPIAEAHVKTLAHLTCGPKGTVVTLSLRRPGAKSTYVVRAVRHVAIGIGVTGR
eukprot:CAMPEP_0206232758 /NCGR_PEP_ID=MMETSP0047_2-20121206/11595_1 /ASSEMBLY_ACC=CAM_ASM_000192 /TAXON_ID=195065 /ORGANISM="Chroomonas mesostigmatica_cf, Strain CCMP1168" /LENGTH=230 /DNA_ID=CAMNT_0053656533 /DNA_START=54 /DNA_END=742 /DNA_ORIENTATION=-